MLDIIKVVRDFLHDPDADRYSDEVIKHLINEAIRDIAIDTLYFRDTLNIIYPLSCMVNGKVLLPDNTIRTLSVKYNFKDIPIQDDSKAICGRDMVVMTNANNINELTLYPSPYKQGVQYDPIYTDAQLTSDDIDNLTSIDGKEIQFPFAYLQIERVYEPQIDISSECKSREVRKAIRHYVLKELYRQDKESIDLQLDLRESKEYNDTKKLLKKQRQSDHSSKLYPLDGYKNAFRR